MSWGKTRRRRITTKATTTRLDRDLTGASCSESRPKPTKKIMRTLKIIRVVNKPGSAKRIWELSLSLKHPAWQSHAATQSLARGRFESIFATRGSAYLGPRVSASA